MSGNIWEWVNDAYSDTYGGYGSGAAESDPPGSTSGPGCVIRGGDWGSGTSNVRVTVRNYYVPSYAGAYVGARLSRSSP